MFLKIKYLFVFFFLGKIAIAQVGGVKGFIKDGGNGEELELANIFVLNSEKGAISNGKGYFVINDLQVGKTILVCSFNGYDSDTQTVIITQNKLITINFFLKSTFITFQGAKITQQRKKKKKEDTDVGTTRIDPKQIMKIPTVGGSPDLVQYLQVLPGVVFSGDQGGQLYIRGGSPVMNKIILDGMTIYNPFHSIGLFSIFDVDLMKSTDVYSAGFGAEYGGRVSAIVDVKTKDGNKKELEGSLSVSPFLGKLTLEGPMKKFEPGKGNSSFIFSLKNSYLDKTAPVFYNYANPERLPYAFNDVYGKVTFNSSNASSIKLFGFNFTDNVNFPNSTKYSWNQSGLGANFTLVPEGRSTIIEGFLSYSDYDIKQVELDNRPRQSSISGLNIGFNASQLKEKNVFKYGFDINAFSTDFTIYNSNNRLISQQESTTELCGYTLYKIVKPRFTLENGLRIQYYASLGNTSIEPRINGKYQISKKLSVKGAVGRYSQNLMSSFSDRDVVNLFYGFLSGPDDIPNQFNGNAITSKLQKARHAVIGVDYEINKFSEIGSEGFFKRFDQITNINREKIFDDNSDFANKPERLRKDYIIETGNAYGGDIRYKYDNRKVYIWAVYSYTIVNRFDGINTYNPHWDRRHNINLVFDYVFDKKEKLSGNVRWNYGSGFPFTQTQGLYEKLDLKDGPSSNYTATNGTLGILYGGFNQGRLPDYHRLDASLKYTFNISKKVKSWIVLSVINVYNRPNIFYFDRVNYKRVDQLPIIPALSFNAKF